MLRFVHINEEIVLVGFPYGARICSSDGIQLHLGPHQRWDEEKTIDENTGNRHPRSAA